MSDQYEPLADLEMGIPDELIRGDLQPGRISGLLERVLREPLVFDAETSLLTLTLDHSGSMSELPRMANSGWLQYLKPRARLPRKLKKHALVFRLTDSEQRYGDLPAHTRWLMNRRNKKLEARRARSMMSRIEDGTVPYRFHFIPIRPDTGWEYLERLDEPKVDIRTKADSDPVTTVDETIAQTLADDFAAWRDQARRLGIVSEEH